jgi:glycine betaine/proline transport system substrate-binding protein
MSVWKTLTGSVAAGTFAAIVAMQAASAEVPESNEPIKLAMNEWTGQHISTVVAGEVLKRMGYNVEYITAGYYPQLTALADGDLDASLEIWSSNIGDGFDEAMSTGNISVVGESGLKPQEEWVVPTYMLEQCPGLPSWEALNDCAELFATADTMPAGRFLDYPAEWGDTNAQRIAALDLNFVSIPSGGEGALIAEMKSAYDRKAPLIMMFWEPHWMWAQYDMTRVNLPAHVEGCETDPAVGPNPDVVYDCDWASSEIWKVVNNDLQNTHPAAWKLIEAYQIDNLEQAQMMSEIDDKGRDLMEVVNEWLDANPDEVQSWVDQATM